MTFGTYHFIINASGQIAETALPRRLSNPLTCQEIRRQQWRHHPVAHGVTRTGPARVAYPGPVRADRTVTS